MPAISGQATVKTDFVASEKESDRKKSPPPFLLKYSGQATVKTDFVAPEKESDRKESPPPFLLKYTIFQTGRGVQ